MFHLFKKETKKKTYDPEKVVPVIRSSICTGEKVAGFRDKATGHMEEIMLIKNDQDLLKFREEYDIRGHIETIY